MALQKSTIRSLALGAGALVIVLAAILLATRGPDDAPPPADEATPAARSEAQPDDAGVEPVGDRSDAARTSDVPAVEASPEPALAEPETATSHAPSNNEQPDSSEPAPAAESDDAANGPAAEAEAVDVPTTPAPPVAGPEKALAREPAEHRTPGIEPARAQDADVAAEPAKPAPQDAPPTKAEQTGPGDTTPERSADVEKKPPAEGPPPRPPRTEPAAPVDIAAVLRDIEKSMKGARTTQAGFVQEKKMAILKKPLVIRGWICLQKPGRFAWYALSPLKYSIVLKDEKVYTWDEDTRKVQKSSLKGNPGMQIAIDHITQWFAGKYSSLQDSYAIRLLKKSPLTLEFTPREGAPARDFMTSVSIVFDEKKGYLRSIFIAEKSGNTSLMTFGDVKINAKLEPHAWEPNQNAW